MSAIHLSHADLTQMSNALRFLSVDAVEKAQSGHPGMPMGMADVATILFSSFLVFNPENPQWLNRDRFILSAGHGSMLLYSLLHLCGYPKMTLGELQNFRQLGSFTPGHPEHGHTPGVETTTGPLGQGLANAVGMAIGEELSKAALGADLIDHKTYVIAGDGCLMEGISQEAITLAGHLRLKNLIVLFDDNQITIDGPTHLSTSENTPQRFEAAGWLTLSCDGHNFDEIHSALSQAQQSDCPVFVSCRTRIGFGSPGKEGTSAAHGSPLGDEEVAKTRAALQWPYGPFEVPENIRQNWATVAQRHRQSYDQWQETWRAFEGKSLWEQRLEKKLPSSVSDELRQLKQTWDSLRPKMATRQVSQEVLEKILPLLPSLVGGSADLTPSNNTKAKGMAVFSHENRHGQYLHYGIREHGMAAMMNGLSLYGGFIPYGGTFLTFADYSRPAIRLSALMELPVIHVMTHDSIGLGEDGPTHQPVEHLAALRAIPQLNVFRPADAMETLECWQLALESHKNPSLLALSRQGLPSIRPAGNVEQNFSALGGYAVRPVAGRADVVFLATGSEVHLALEAAEILAHKFSVRVVSCPCLELLFQQSEAYRAALLDAQCRVAIEAGIAQGWHQLVGADGFFVGMSGFGASAPAPQLFEHFGITTSRIVELVENFFEGENA